MQDLAGRHGKLFSCLGMHEAVNFQSNLDSRKIDFDRELRQLCATGKISFLQLYADSPHIHVKSPFKHPVSGTIVTAGLADPQYLSAMDRRAREYLLHMQDLVDKVPCPLALRVEQVAIFDDTEGIPHVLVAAEFFRVRRLHHLLHTAPLVLPFTISGDEWDDWDPVSLLQLAVGHMVEELRKLFHTSAGKGGFEPSWQAYQLDLALEEVFYGHPLAACDTQLNAALGTSTTREMSLTHWRGMIGMAEFSAAASGNVPPPLSNWTKDDLQVTRIERIWDLCESLSAGHTVIGEALVLVFFKDLFKSNKDLPLGEMKKDQKPPGPLKGALTLENLTNDLAVRDSFPSPFVFSRARQLVNGAGKDVANCLLLGFQAMEIRWFPAIKYRDLRKHKVLTWNFVDCGCRAVLQGPETICPRPGWGGGRGYCHRDREEVSELLPKPREVQGVWHALDDALPDEAAKGYPPAEALE